MRAISTAFEQLITARGGVTRRTRVSVKDSGGTFRDLTTYLGPNFVCAVSWHEETDGNGFDCDVECFLRYEGINLSPFMQGSPANLGLAYPGAYAALIDLGREVLVEWAIAPSGLPDSLLTWVEGMRGEVDDMSPAPRMRFKARGRFGRIIDAFIEEERIYNLANTGAPTQGCMSWSPSRAGQAVGLHMLPSESRRNGHWYKVDSITTGISAATEPTWPTGAGVTVVDGGVTYRESGTTSTSAGTALETVIQRLFNDNGMGAFTLNTPVSPGWNIRQYQQQRQPTWSAARALVDQIGWDLRDKWDGGSSTFKITLSTPDRAKVVPDRTFGPGDRYPIRRVQKKLDGIRNAIRVIFLDSQDLDSKGNPKRKVVERTDATSIAKYGRKFMEVSEDKTSNIDSVGEAQTFADAILADLKEPNAEFEADLPFFPFCELGDLYRFSADGVHYDTDFDLAVVGYRHAFTTGHNPQARTTLTLRGKPSGGWARWLATDAGRDGGQAGPTHQLQLNNGDSFALQKNPVPGGHRIWVTENLNKQGLGLGHEIHVSATPSFTPSQNTLVHAGELNGITMGHLYAGGTYYTQDIPFDRNATKIVQGYPSIEDNFVAGYVEPHHMNPEKFRGELPPNGSFEGNFRAASPPDRWEMKTGVWNTDAGLGPIKGGVDARDGAKYLRFINTNLKTAVQGGEYFPVNGGNVHQISAWIYRNGGSNSVELQLEWVTSTKAAISTSTLTVALSTLTDSAWNLIRTVFIAPATAAFARVNVQKSAVSTDQFHVDGVKVVDCGEAWHEIGASGEPAFQNSWVNYNTGTHAKAAFRCDAIGKWHMKGLIKSGTLPLVFTLPAAAIPPLNLNFACIDGTDKGNSRVEIDTSGQVSVLTGNNAYIAFDGISWFAFG